ncbi:ABC transporter permease [Jiangella endophytica]|uniref:ABC transporter permease n=1 Tax=Jiangella endophytica TaxID=1623398 RepID=UPI0018E50054|nr:ABC transporter permease [Jiangella endophytica]
MTELITPVAPAPPGGPAEPVPAAERRDRGLVRRLLRPGLVVAIAVVSVALLWAFVPGWFTGHDPITGVPAQNLRPPGADHWFGTDHLGRDLFARVVHGSALSLQAALIAVLIGLLAGSTIGLLSGFAGGAVDDVLMRVVDVLLAIPGLLLSLAVVTVLGFGTVNVAVAVGVASVATFARVMRGEVLRVRQATYIEAAFASGVRWTGVLRRHVLPNSAGPVVVLAALEFGQAILAVSALSFLGFGAAPPAPEWGSLISEGRNHLATSWWLTTLPGLVVIAVVLATSRISRALGGDGSTTW